jgi:hypothetical protein
MKIGVSGHQDIFPEKSVDWVKANLHTVIVNKEATSGISCLAVGTDQLFASVIVNLTLNLIVVIPCDDYETTFHNREDISSYQRYKELAIQQHRLNYHMPSQQAFLDAGKCVVDLADIMIFVWDGKPADGIGGTADIVRYANDRKRPYILLNPVSRTIISVVPAL